MELRRVCIFLSVTSLFINLFDKEYYVLSMNQNGYFKIKIALLYINCKFVLHE